MKNKYLNFLLEIKGLHMEGSIVLHHLDWGSKWLVTCLSRKELHQAGTPSSLSPTGLESI